MKSAHPPTPVTANITTPTTWTPIATRDEDALPDIGYHYDPLDYVVSGRSVSANLTLSGGVAVGTYGSATTYGMVLTTGSLISEGTPTRMNWIVRYNTVQEQSASAWSATSVGPSVKRGSTPALVDARFTGWSMPGGTGEHFKDVGGHSGNTPTAAFSHCQFGGGRFTLNSNTGWDQSAGAVGLTNCLWERVWVTLSDSEDNSLWHLFNNLFFGGRLTYQAEGLNPVLLAYDNLFDRTIINNSSPGFTHGHNGYVSATHLSGVGAGGDRDITSPADYQAGPLGGYYYPTTVNGQNLATLIDAGSRTAVAAELDQFTTRPDETPDSGTVDIGFHYAPCLPVISGWVFTDEGFIDGGRDGAWRTYNDPSGVTASPWSFQSPNLYSLRISFEEDWNCANYNINNQSGTADTAFVLACPMLMTLTWAGLGEQYEEDFETLYVHLDGWQVVYVHSRGGGLLCGAPMAPVVSDTPSPLTILLEAGSHTLSIVTQTGDKNYHIGAYLQVDFRFDAP